MIGRRWGFRREAARICANRDGRRYAQRHYAAGQAILPMVQSSPKRISALLARYHRQDDGQDDGQDGGQALLA